MTKRQTYSWAMIAFYVTLVITILAPHARADETCMHTIRERYKHLRAKANGSGVVSLSEDGRTLRVTGALMDDDIRSFKAMTDEQKSKIQFVMLNSPGGSVLASQYLEEFVMKRGSSVNVVVPDGGICASSCTNIFRCAHNRVASASALFMFHRSSSSTGKNLKAANSCPQAGEPGFDLADPCHDPADSSLAAMADQEFGNGECAKQSGQKDGRWTSVGEKIRKYDLPDNTDPKGEWCAQATELSDQASDFLALEKATSTVSSLAPEGTR